MSKTRTTARSRGEIRQKRPVIPRGKRKNAPDSLTFEGIKIVFDPVFDSLDHPMKGGVVVISNAAAKAIDEARAKLGRHLTLTEIISCMIHQSAIAVLDCAKPKRRA